MYKLICKIFVAIAVLGCAFTNIEAQKPINALNYTLQKRPPVDSLPGKYWYENMFVSGGIGIESVINGITVRPGRHRIAPAGVIYVGKWLNSVSGFRIGIQGGIPMHQLPDVQRSYFIHAGLSADYMMNWSNYLYGYTPRRVFNFIPFVGIGGEMSALNRNCIEPVGVLRGGIQAAFRLTPGIQLFFEPAMRIYTDEFNHQANWRRFDVNPSLLAGLTYNIVPISQRMALPSYLAGPFDRFFVSAAAGVDILLNGTTVSNHFDEYIEPTFAVSFGNWFTSVSGFRLSLTGSTYKRGRDYLTMFGTQMDYMLNLQALSEGYRTDRLFRLYGIAGLNCTFPEKTGNTDNCFGFGVGLQGNFRLSSVLDFFIEPRMNIYSDDFAGGFSSSKYDIPAQILFGFNYHRPDNAAYRRGKFAQNDLFHHLFVSAGLGLNAPIAGFMRIIKGDVVQPYLTANVGKWLTPISGIRVSAQAGLLGEVNNRNKYVRTKLVGIGADYLIDLSNLMQGYDENRTFNFRGFAGISSLYNSAAYKKEEKEMAWGIQGGFQIAAKVASPLEVYLEPRLGIYTYHLVSGVLPPLNKDVLASISAGLIYSFRGYEKSAAHHAFDSHPSKRFISIAGGIGTDINSSVSTWSTGPLFEIYFGKHYTPLSSWRMGFRYSHYPQIPETRYSVYENYYGVDLDYMMNLSTLAAGYRHNRPVSAYALAGVSLGVSNNTKTSRFVPGIHGGMHVNFRINNRTVLFAEPRIDLFGKNFMMNNNASRNFDVSLGGMIGIAYLFE